MSAMQHGRGAAKIGQRDAAIQAQHDVFRLDVAVHDTGQVYGVQRLRNLAHHTRRPLRGQLRAKQAAQVAALEVLHGDVGVRVGKTLVMDADHMRVVDLR